MPDYDENYVSGCHGTVAEQLDEAYYDDRSDADDDMQKGRIKFPKDKLYGREKELGILRQLYDAMEVDNLEEEVDEETAVAGGGQRISFEESSSPNNVDSRVVFLSGYSGVGKSALVAEFINQIQREHNTSTTNNNSFPVLHFSGKYIQQSGGAAPFSAISEVFGNFVSSLVNGQKENKLKEGESSYTRSLCTKIWRRIQSSDVIGPDTDGNEVLSEIFPSLRPLLDGSVADLRNKLQRVESTSNLEGGGKNGEPSMNAVKESTRELLAQITSTLQRPLILFLDDLQWADGPSLELLSFLMGKDAQLKNLMLICAYRSNEVSGDHPFADIIMKVTESRGELVAKIDLFSLSQDAICQFIADSIGMEEQDRVSELVEVIYPKTMGNIFCVMQALEELVRKNALYYDMMYFEWRWTVDKIELDNLVSEDVVETIKDKIKGLSVDIQKLLAVMAYIPCAVGVPVLKELLGNYKGNTLDEDKIAFLLKEASQNGMLMWSTESGNYIFSHDRIREASRGCVVEQDRDELLSHMAHVLVPLGKGSKMEWCLYTAVDLLNSLSPDQVDIADLIKLNLRVSRMAKSRGSPEKENMLLRESLERLKPSKWKDYNLSLEVYNAVMASEYNLGNHDQMSAAIDEVLNHATFLKDKFSAYLHGVKHLSANLNDYRASSHEGVKVLNMFSYNIPLQPTKADMVREKVKLKLALKGRSFASLINLHVTEDPIFELFAHVCMDSMFSGQPRLVTVVAWIAVRRAIQVGCDGYFLQTLLILGQVQGKKGKLFRLKYSIQSVLLFSLVLGRVCAYNFISLTLLYPHCVLDIRQCDSGERNR